MNESYCIKGFTTVLELILSALIPDKSEDPADQKNFKYRKIEELNTLVMHSIFKDMELFGDRP